MPISKNTSSSGAPKRSASRLDRMPAMTRTAPSRMAMLTESREAMNLRSQSQPAIDGILIVATVGRQPIFAACAKWPGFAGQLRLTGASSRMAPERRLWESAAVSNQICQAAAAHALKRDFHYGHE